MKKQQVLQLIVFNKSLGDFNEVKGRITADSAHRGLDASETPNPAQALRPLHAADLGFLHSETSLAALAEYQRIEIRQEHRVSKAGGIRGLFGGKITQW